MGTPPSTTERALIVAGGAMHTTPDPHDVDLVIAADSGYDNALAADIFPDVLVGDLDSISPDGLADARRRSVTIHEHPADKDATDLELALGVAIDAGARQIAIHGGDDGQLGHLLGVVHGLAKESVADIDVSWHRPGAISRVATPAKPVALTGTTGDTVSLLPLGGVSGVSTSGLRWSLASETLEVGSSRGLSNELTNSHAEISISAGALLVIHEGAMT